MSATREAVVLPALFFTVAFAGGIRPGADLTMPPPPVFVLILAVLLIANLVQSGAFDPARLINPHRSVLANANGVAVLASLFLAAAQLFSVLTPVTGLPRLILGIYFLVLMLNTLAAHPDRVRLLRSLAVTFGAAFLLKYVLLAPLSDPATSRLGRAMQTLFDSVTLGVIAQQPQPASAGYLALMAVGLFLLAVWLLPPREAAPGELVATPRRPVVTGIAVRDDRCWRSTSSPTFWWAAVSTRSRRMRRIPTMRRSGIRTSRPPSGVRLRRCESDRASRLSHSSSDVSSPIPTKSWRGNQAGGW